MNDFGGCKDSTTKKITVVKRASPVFTATDSLSCDVPFSVQFINQTPGNNTYRWEFGDGTTSTEVNPLHTYTKTGNFTVKLIAFNANGCSDTLAKTNWIKIQQPVITINGVPQTGCNPVTVHPTATISSIKPIASYLWKFGDGTTSNERNPAHSYTTAGNYDLTLIVTTINGCSDSVVIKNAVRVGDKPHADFNAFPPQVCNANPVQFTDKSTGNVDQWLWNFGDSLSSEKQNPSHVFDGVGKFSVMLIVWSNTCADTIRKENVVNVLPPVSQFSVKGTCNDKYKKEFTNASYGATSWRWDFGDGGSSTEKNPSHNYTKPGIYKVMLYVANETCTNVNWDTVYVVDEHAAIVADKEAICKGNEIHFSSPAVNAANIVNWLWDFGDGNTSSAVPVSHSYSKTGKYMVRLKVTDRLGCTDSAFKKINVHGATAVFSVNNAVSCLVNNDTRFSDASFTDGSHAIVKRIWNYGDGTIDSISSAPFHHSYAQTGEYKVSLAVVDAFGCRDEAINGNAVIIAQPHSAFYSPDSLSCVGKQIHFVNQSNGYDLNYQWSFGDGRNETSKDPSHQYSKTGAFNISLVATDKYGCKDSASKNNYVTISLPKAQFNVSDSFGTCPPLMVHFTSKASNYINIKWDFGDGNTSTLENPSHYYTTAGIFYAKQIITSNGGCTDTATQKIVVKGPSGNFSYTPISGCNPLTVNFTAATQNTISFVWDFSDGTTLSANGSSASHTYNTPGEFIPKIILVDAGGCSVPIVGKDTIKISSVAASFEINTNSFCTAGTAQFRNTTVANDYITKYQWSFGDGSTTNETDPSHAYASVGSYSVHLIATTRNGCTDTATLADTIRILESPQIVINGDTAACVPASLQFNSEVKKGIASELNWQWDFGNGESSSQKNVLPQAYTSAGLHHVVAIATAKNGCKDTANLSVNIHPLPVTNAGNDVSICKGNSIQLNATGASSYVWSNASSLNCSDCASPLAKPTDSVMYIVTGFTPFGCNKKDSVIVKVHQPFILKVGEGDTVCAGTPVHLMASGADVYSWFPSTGVEQTNSSHTIATPQTSTVYYVVAKDKNNCFADTASVFVKVWPIPAVSVGADKNLVVGEAIQLETKNSPDVSSWQWNNAGTLSCATCSTTLAKPKQTTTYTVKVANDGGCTAKDDVTISVICNNGNLFIPNTFSPNGDGVNDKFFPSGKGINMIKTLRVFNRWGQVVFERINFSANDEAAGWDGTFKGQVLPPDVYVYSCDVVCQNNEVLNFKGDVTLLR